MTMNQLIKGEISKNKPIEMNAIGNPPTLPFSQHPRTHSRSASWSHTSGAAASLPLLSPIRVIQEFVPSFSSNTRQNDNEDGLPSWNGPRHRPDNGGHGGLSRSTSGIDLEAGENTSSSQGRSPGNNGRQSGDRVEFYGAITWAENILPFVLLLCSRIMWDHRLGWYTNLNMSQINFSKDSLGLPGNFLEELFAAMMRLKLHPSIDQRDHCLFCSAILSLKPSQKFLHRYIFIDVNVITFRLLQFALFGKYNILPSWKIS